MAGKPTALQRAEIEKQRRQKEQELDLRHVGMTIAFTLLAISCLWWAYQVISHLNTDRQASALVGSLDSVRDTLLRDFREKESQILLAAESAQALDAAKSGNSGALASAALDLQNRLDDAEWVRLMLPDVEGLRPEPHPGLGYAGIYLLLKAKETGQAAGPGGGLVRTPNANYSWAVPITERVDNNSRRLYGFMLVRYPIRLLTTALDTVDVGGGYVDLRLYSQLGSGLVVSSRGAHRAAAEYLTLVDVGDTEFKLAYHLTTMPLQNQWPWWTNFIALLISAGLLYWAFEQRRRMNGVVAADDAGEEEFELEDEAPLTEALETALGVASKNNSPAPKPRPSLAGDIPKSIFRAYDIRGVVGQTLTPEFAELIGRAIGSEARHRNQGQVVVARDGRNSGPAMTEALIKGLCAAGVDVIDIGAVPTGVLYYATHSLETGSGVMVTGSHNPPDYNGFKIMLGGDTLALDDITDLYRRIDEGDLASGEGGVQEYDILDDYVDRIASDVQVEEPLKVVADCGNGIPGRVAPLVLEEIGCEVIPLFCDVDGDFPNHHPDPSDMENLKDLIAAVKSLDADLGVAFDGDGDRLGVVTRSGSVIFPDRLLMLFAEDVLIRNPGAAIIYDVKCTSHLAKVILGHGGSPIMWKTGHSLIKGKMKEVDAALAGEMSGHFFFKERWYGFDDGIYACARLLEILAAHPDGVDGALNELPQSVSTPEIKVEMVEGEHYEFMEQFSRSARFSGARITAIDGIRADYDDGWGLVRCSNTTPCLVLRFDADSNAVLERIQASFREQILAVRDDLDLPF